MKKLNTEKGNKSGRWLLILVTDFLKLFTICFISPKLCSLETGRFQSFPTSSFLTPIWTCTSVVQPVVVFSVIC